MRITKMYCLITKRTLLFILIAVITIIGILVMTQQTSIGHNMRKMYKFNANSNNLHYNSYKRRRKMHTDNKQDVPLVSSLKPNKIPTKTEMLFKSFKSSSIVEELTDVFQHKISKITTKKAELDPVCHSPETIANSCNNNKCLQTTFPVELKERISQIVKPSKLQISPQNEQVFDSMAKEVKGGFEFMILTAASSNHFLEVQALIQNLHTNIYPHLKNFTLVLYNIGLTPEERSQMVRFCRCQVIDFPFHKFSNFVSKNLCYSWKPVIVRAHFGQAAIVLWVDASIRFDSDPSYFSYLLQRARSRSIQTGKSPAISPFRTFRSMYHFFGDEPCMYLNMGQVQSGIDLFTNEFFVKRVILDPWAACALNESCMCPVDRPNKSCAESKRMTAAWLNQGGPIVYGLCHRFDQSSLSIILHKLYQDHFRWVTFDVSSYIDIKRKNTFNYFDTLRLRNNV